MATAGRRGSGGGIGGRAAITPEALGPVLARHLADPAVAAVSVVHGGRLVVERIDGRTERPAPLPRGEADRIVAGLAIRLGRPPGDRRPIVAEDPRADLAVAALASDGLAGAVLSAARTAPPRLRAWMAAGLLGAPEAARLRALVRDGANLVVAARPSWPGGRSSARFSPRPRRSGSACSTSRGTNASRSPCPGS